MKKFRIGVVGVGGRADYGHIAGIERSPDMELVAICDILPERLAAVGDKHGVREDRRFVDYKELIACADVDAVSICTSNDAHHEIALEAIRAGKPYALEKPVTMTAAEADELMAETERRDLKNMVCFSYRFKASARYARELVKSGALGKIYHLNMEYSQAFALPCFNTPLYWRFIKSKAGSGALGDLGIHAIDLARFVTGKEFLRVVADAETYVTERALPDGSGRGVADVDDYCNYLAKMEDGIAATFRITRCAFGRGNYQRMEVYGGKGSLVYTLDANSRKDELAICIGEQMGELRLFTDVDAPGRFHADEMQAFADILNGRGDGLTGNIRDGAASQRVAEAALNSLDSLKWVSV